MIKQSSRHSADSSDYTSTPAQSIASEADGFAGATHFTQGGANVTQANGHPAGPGHSVDDATHAAGNADDPAGHHALFADLLAIDDAANASDDGHTTDHPHLTAWNPADVTSTPGASHSLNAETQHSGLVDSLSHNDLSGLFDHIDSLTDGARNSAADGGFNPSLDYSFDSSHVHPIGLSDVFSDGPDVFSNARPSGGGHGGGGHGGSTAPQAYDTHSGTGVDFHVTYDSSVGSAPSGFTSVIQDVANFFANSFTSLTHITINIDVGYGEVHNTNLGPGALGASVTYLQSISYSQLENTYSSSDVTLGGQAPGNMYVSFAEGKALGYVSPNATAIDGYVGFTSQSGIFDYNNTDGISSGQYDFFGVVSHEFSEVMGRILLVGATINHSASYMAYDLFHYSGSGAQDFSGNGGYFSTDGGVTNIASFNNASNGGDAGDWASGGSVDAFNAFGSPGVAAPVTNIDLWALHAVGFDLATPMTV